MKDWKEIEIKDLGRVVTGKTPPTSDRSYFDGEFNFISPKDLDFDSRYIRNTITTITAKAIEKFKNQVLPKNSVMFTSLSYGFGKMGITDGDCITNQQINSIVVDEENYDYNFVYYLLRHYKEILFSYSSGIVTPIVPKSVFEKVKILVPKNKKDQSRIAAILSAYDDLIENNLKRIRLLEEKAFLRYKEIVRGERLEEKVSVFDYAEIMSGGTPSTTNPHYWDGDIPFFTPKDLSSQTGYYLFDTERKLTELGLEKCNSRLFPRNTIFITARGTVGKLVLAKVPSAMSQSNYAITTKNGSANYFLFLALIDKISHFKQLAVGGVFDTIIVDTFKMIFLELPSEKIINHFNSEIEPTFLLIDNLQKQNARLREARDILLPRLMSGELVV